MRIFRFLLPSLLTFSIIPVSRADNKSEEGLRLINHALALSDIRADGAPAFHLAAKFRDIGGSSTVEGTYSETWVSRQQWRRETEIGDFRRIEVAGGAKKWSLDSEDAVPPALEAVAGALDVGNLRAQAKVSKVISKNIDGVNAKCVRTEKQVTKDLWCLDPQKGVLLAHEISLPGWQSSYFYKNYQEVGGYLFPRSIEYRHKGEPGVDIDVDVLELRAEPSPDPSQFAPLRNALETANCSPNEMIPPREKFAPEPTFPSNERADTALVILSLIVGPDGVPQHVRIKRTGGVGFDAEALRTVEHWKFKPGTCRGEPVPILANVEVNFHGRP